MNEARQPGNRRTVLTLKQTPAPLSASAALRLAPLAFALALLSGGCGGARGLSGSLTGLSPGTTALRITNHVASPGALDGVSVEVDGEPVALTAIPPEGDDVATIAALHLDPGSHSVSVRIRARAPGGLGGAAAPPNETAEVRVVGAQQPFLIQRGPAAITIDVRSNAPATDGAAAAPVAISLTIVGGRMAPEFGVAPSSEKDERCAGLLPIPRAVCRAAFDLDEATRKDDIAGALCVRDKLAEMRKLALIGESGKGDSLAMAEEKVARLSHQVDLCAGDFSSSVAPDGVTVVPPKRR
jgi:hypothetical protein